MMLGFKLQEHNLSTGAAGVEDGKVKAEGDQDMGRSPSKTERASERNQDITEDLKKKIWQFVARTFVCVCNESNVTLQL